MCRGSWERGNRNTQQDTRKGNKRDSALVSWVLSLLMGSSTGDQELGVGALGGKGVPLGVLASRLEGQGQHTWLKLRGLGFV